MPSRARREAAPAATPPDPPADPPRCLSRGPPVGTPRATSAVPASTGASSAAASAALAPRSASRKSRHSRPEPAVSRAATTPRRCASARPTGCGSRSTRAPDSSATRQVESVEPSSTTTIGPTRGSFRAASTVRAIRDASLRAGITTTTVPGESDAGSETVDGTESSSSLSSQCVSIPGSYDCRAPGAAPPSPRHSPERRNRRDLAVRQTRRCVNLVGERAVLGYKPGTRRQSQSPPRATSRQLSHLVLGVVRFS